MIRSPLPRTSIIKSSLKGPKKTSKRISINGSPLFNTWKSSQTNFDSPPKRTFLVLSKDFCTKNYFPTTLINKKSSLRSFIQRSPSTGLVYIEILSNQLYTWKSFQRTFIHRNHIKGLPYIKVLLTNFPK